jgi:hypothetical protein
MSRLQPKSITQSLQKDNQRPVFFPAGVGPPLCPRRAKPVLHTLSSRAAERISRKNRIPWSRALPKSASIGSRRALLRN